CPEEDKVPLASFTLQDQADEWWTSALRTVFRDREDIAWRDFLAAFRAKFFPAHIQDKMEQEFLNLSQGSMSVMEYEACFLKLEKFARHVCADERRRATKFVRGLKGYIHSRIMAHNHQTLESAVQAACLQETEQEMFLDEKRASQKSTPVFDARSDRKRKLRPPAAVPPPAVRQATTPAAPVGPQRIEYPICPRCGKRHGGSECWA